jgi:hypothetical protein
VITMTRLAFTEARYAALTAVHRDHVAYHTGLSGPALGYTWSERVGGQMFEDMRQVLRDLWTADLIEVDTHRVLAQRGHRVNTTTSGYFQLREWEGAKQQSRAA